MGLSEYENESEGPSVVTSRFRLPWSCAGDPSAASVPICRGRAKLRRRIFDGARDLGRAVFFFAVVPRAEMAVEPKHFTAKLAKGAGAGGSRLGLGTEIAQMTQVG